jgi:hypothetical protein
MTKTKHRAPPCPEEVARLKTIVWAVWNYIGMDCGDIDDNETAIEMCLDADRPLLSTQSKDPKSDHAFCKDLFTRYPFSDCVKAVSKVTRLV